MVEVRRETVTLLKRFIKRTEESMVHSSDAPAPPAHQVVVMGMPVQLVLDTPLPEVRLRNEAKLGEQVKAAIYGRFI